MTKKWIKAPTVYLPSHQVDLSKWSVVACDQYTSEREYWQQVRDLVGDKPSSLDLVFPEVYLEDNDKSQRIKDITRSMYDYLDKGVLKPLKESYIYVERTTQASGLRKGLIACIDLEDYDYNHNSDSPIRATEGTVLERIPP